MINLSLLKLKMRNILIKDNCVDIIEGNLANIKDERWNNGFFHYDGLQCWTRWRCNCTQNKTL